MITYIYYHNTSKQYENMACSKVCSGDTPELLYTIIKNLQDDFTTLHSCVLTNKLWCQLTIPLLWEKPFSLESCHSIIEIYLHYLNDDDKTKLNEAGISNELFPLNVSFNYPSFIKYLDMENMDYIIRKWLKTVKKNIEIYNLIFYGLFKIFTENGASLRALAISFPAGGSRFEVVCRYIDSTFIRNIEVFSLKYELYDEFISVTIMETFTNLISFHCNSIS